MAEPELAVLLRTCKHSEIDITSRKNALPNKFGYALKCDNISISYTKTPIQVPIPQQSPQLIDIGVYRPSVSTSGVVDTIGGTATSGQAKTATELSDAITDAAATSFAVASVANITAKDVIRVGDEDMDVTSISSTTLTVVRGINGTTATTHLDEAVVTSYGPAFFEGMSSISYTRTNGYGAAAGTKSYYVPYKNQLEDFATQYVYSSSTPLELEWGDANFAKGTQQTGGSIYLVALQQIRFQVDASKEDRYTFSMQFVVTSRKDKA